MPGGLYPDVDWLAGYVNGATVRNPDWATAKNPKYVDFGGRAWPCCRSPVATSTAPRMLGAKERF